MSTNQIILIIAVPLFLLSLRIFTKKRKEAIYTIERHLSSFRHNVGCATALADFNECRNLLMAYLISPRFFGFDDLGKFQMAAIASLELYLARARVAHVQVMESKKKGEATSSMVQMSEMSIMQIVDDIRTLRSSLPNCKPKFVTA